MRRSCTLLARPCRLRRHDLPATLLSTARAGSSTSLLTTRRRLSTTAGRLATASPTPSSVPSSVIPDNTASTPTATPPNNEPGEKKNEPQRRSARQRSLLTLAIESSCDDTCVAILEKTGSAAKLHFNKKITSDNRSFGGVYPEAAVQSHVSSMAPLLKRALKALPADEGVGSTGGGGIVWAAGKARRKPDFVTVTRGPGMLSNLTVGLMTAKSLAVAWDVPLLAVHHMEAHALTPRLVHALEQGKLASPATETASSSSSSASSADEDGKSDTDDEKMTKKQENDTGAPGRTEFPFLSLLVSGGHSLLVHSRGLNDHSILAEAHNIAIGDLLDKCARVILPESYIAAAPDVMYGRLLEEFAFPTSAGSPKGWDAAEIVDQGYEYAPPRTKLDEKRTYRSQARGWSLTPPLHESAAMRFDFSGLNGRVHAIMRGDPSALPPRGGGGGGEDVGVNINAHPLSVRNRRELARVTMRIAFEHLASRLLMALKKLAPKVQEKEEGPQLRAIKTVVVSGGVASNKYLRHILRAMLDARGFAGVEIVCPPVHLCTDNAAMIAWAGMEMYEAGWRSELDVRPIKKWPLDPGGEGEGGVLGVPGWYSEKQPVGE